MDYLRWALVDQPLPAHDDPVLTMLKALAEIHDLQRLQRISGPRDQLALARRQGVEMPITEVMTAVMHQGLPVSEAAALLASRSAKPEWYGSER